MDSAATAGIAVREAILYFGTIYSIKVICYNNIVIKTIIYGSLGGVIWIKACFVKAHWNGFHHRNS